MANKYMTFQGPTFDMLVPTNWLITSSPEIQAAFIAPEPGKVRSNLVITMRGAADNVSVPELAETAKNKQQEEYTQYAVVEEKDWSKESYQAFERRYTWLNNDHDLTVNQRQVFILYNHIFYTITTTATDTPLHEEIEKVFITMLNSFKIRENT